MEKKQYIQPAIQCYGVNTSAMICASGGSTTSLDAGTEDGPETTTQDGCTGIFCDSKRHSSWDDEDDYE